MVAQRTGHDVATSRIMGPMPEACHLRLALSKLAH